MDEQARRRALARRQAIGDALAAEPRLTPHRHEIQVSVSEDGTPVIDGEVPDVQTKKLALGRATQASEGGWVVDRLRVAPAEPMRDAEIRDHVCDALLQEPAFVECKIIRSTRNQRVTLQDPEKARGDLCVGVEAGVVTLDGDLPTRAHKRLAGVLAWWVPGSRDVIDGMGVLSPEVDNDEELTDAVRMALEKDPFVDATQLKVSTEDSVVRLRGFVTKPAESELATHDAWYVFGVVDVINDVEVQS